MARPTHPVPEEEEEEEEPGPTESGPTESGPPPPPLPPPPPMTDWLTAADAAATANVDCCWILVVALAGRVEYSTLATLEPTP